MLLLDAERVRVAEGLVDARRQRNRQISENEDFREVDSCGHGWVSELNDGLQHVVRLGLQVAHRIRHYRLVAGNAGREQRQSGGERQRRQKLLLRFLLLQFLQQQHQLHSNRSQTATTGAVQTAIAEQSAE